MNLGGTETKMRWQVGCGHFRKRQQAAAACAQLGDGKEMASQEKGRPEGLEQREEGGQGRLQTVPQLVSLGPSWEAIFRDTQPLFFPYHSPRHTGCHCLPTSLATASKCWVLYSFRTKQDTCP